MNIQRLSTVALLSIFLTASSTWAQTALHGTQEFLGAGTYTWTAPARKTILTLELWGAGGGGTQRIVPNARSGNGGGSGAYVRSVIVVLPGQTYSIIVGSGGVGDTGSGFGGAGGATQISDSIGSILLFAAGGSGGSKTPDTGGAGGTPDPNAGVQRSGHVGGTSQGIGGNLGGAAVNGSVQLPYLMDGGIGASYRSVGPGGDGGNGYAIISW